MYLFTHEANIGRWSRTRHVKSAALLQGWKTSRIVYEWKSSSVALTSSSILIFYFFIYFKDSLFLGQWSVRNSAIPDGCCCKYFQQDSQNRQQRVHKSHNDVEGRTERWLMFSRVVGTSGGPFRNVQGNVAYKEMRFGGNKK